MSKEYSALMALKNYWATQIDATPETALAAAQILIEYPDIDKMPFSQMLYIVPEMATNELIATQDELETMAITVYLLLKYDSMHTTMASLVEAAFDHYAGLFRSMITDPQVGGSFIETHIDSFDFYPAVAGIAHAVGMEIKLTVKFERAGDLLPADDVLPGTYLVPGGD